MNNDTATAQREREFFDTHGYVGPFKLWEPKRMRRFWGEQRRALLDPTTRQHATYPGNPLNYDRHLDIPGLRSLVSEPLLAQKASAVLGPDLLCWRTEFFPKNPGSPGTGWHQVETYTIGDTDKSMLVPTKRVPNQPIELTIWVAFTSSSRENGCLRLLPGTHHTWRYDEKRPQKHVSELGDVHPGRFSFFGYDYSELKVSDSWTPEDEVAFNAEMEAGEFVIFTARTVHGSLPNRSRRQRVGFAIRIVPTHVRVYDGMTEFKEFGEHFDLSRHRCVQILGTDEYKHNRVSTDGYCPDETS
ncbi:MAG: chlorinating enzyme [Planctomycetota bacterium]